MTSVNKIKELAEAKEFWEALDLVEEQDLEKSYNPQFLRLCGEIYLENGRYEESRKALLRAHIMAPEGNRIIYELVRLYLHMGYFNRAERYFEQYEANAIEDDIGTVHLMYLIGKARHKDIRELLAILLPVSDDETEEKWIFEVALLYSLVDRKDKAIEECNRIIELYKNTRYAQLAVDLIEDKFDVNASFYRYPLIEELEPEEQDELVKKEEEQLLRDYDRMHPKDPVIVSMVDDDEEEIVPKQNKRFRFFKKNKDIDEQENNNQEAIENIEESVTDDAEVDNQVEEIAEEVAESNGQVEAAVEEVVEANNQDEEIAEEVAEANDQDEEIAEEIAESNNQVEEVVEKIAEANNQDEEMVEKIAEANNQDEEIVEKTAESDNQDEDRSIKEKLEQLVSLSKEEDMELPSYEDISITSEDELAEKYKDREIGADGIDEMMMSELPETSILLKKLMDNQKHIEKELEEKQMYGIPLTDEYIEQLERELEEELSNLAPILEERLSNIEIDSKEDDTKEISENDVVNSYVENLLEETKLKDNISNDESLNSDDYDLFEDLQVSDDIDSTDIVELYDLDEVLKENLRKEEELQQKAENILISLGITDVGKYATGVKEVNNEILSKYGNDFEREKFKQYLVIDDNKSRLLCLLKERK